MKKLGIWIVIFAIVFGVFFGIKLYNRNAANQAVLNETPKLLKQIPGYQENADFFDRSLQAHHTDAFNQSYSLRGSQDERFDQTKYMVALISKMKEDAVDQGKSDLADLLGHVMESSKQPPADQPEQVAPDPKPNLPAPNLNEPPIVSSAVPLNSQATSPDSDQQTDETQAASEDDLEIGLEEDPEDGEIGIEGDESDELEPDELEPDATSAPE